MTSTHPQRLDHGAIGNGRVLALVGPDSAVDWLCLPQWDSPSVFGSLLDQERGGTWRIDGPNGRLRGELAYARNTNILIGTFHDGDAAWEVVDFAPRIPQGLDVHAPYELVRLVRPLRGSPRLRVHFDPRPDYGRANVSLLPHDGGIDVIGGPHRLRLATNAPVPFVLAGQPFVLQEPVWMVLTLGERDRPPDLAGVQRQLEQTLAGWRAWVRSCALPPFRQQHVLRSALCLKLHAHLDTGAIIAATTTSLPEAMGTQRTWDYRYCWLRDAAFVVESLRRLSHLAEGEAFLRFLRDVAESGPLQPVYGLDGRRELHEQFLPHLAGYRGNGHVRIGNAAWHQQQNDLMGELLLSLESLLSDPRLVHDEGPAVMPLIERLVREAIAARERDEVLTRGYSQSLGFFTQALDGQNPDASNLLLPSIGLIDARDERFTNTLRAYEERLVERGFMLRYKNADDFGETTSAFTICSFWWAEALALSGRLDDAVAVFDRMVAHCNPLGLFSEDVEPTTGELLGNFPQAYTHVGLINAATTIGNLLAARDGEVRAWA